MVNFGIRPAIGNSKNAQVKDSIELANNRIVNRKDFESDEIKRDKKSVRFAAKLSENRGEGDEEGTIRDSSKQAADQLITVNQIYNYQVLQQNKENEQQQQQQQALASIANCNFLLILNTNFLFLFK